MITLNWSGYKKLTEDGINSLPTYSGVYKLATYNTQSELYTPFYVGQAEDIKARTQQHAGENEENSCINTNFDKYSVYMNHTAVSKQEDRDAVEVALYNRYTPECNNKDSLPDVVPAAVSSFN